MSGWWKSLPNGLPNVVSLPKSGHRRAGKGREFPWRCNVDTIAVDLKVSWEMSVMIDVQDADHATATAYWLMFKLKKSDVLEGKVSTAAPHFSETEDQLVRTDKGWRIARRDFNEII